jgi:O-antigen/teichoic acid export membrane protein
MWGLISNVLQNLLFSVFFVIIARVYSESEFGNYILANTIYSFVMGFSSLGLGHWFVRELINSEDKEKLTHSFFKIQALIGLFFYVLNIGISFSLYHDPMVRKISLILGINIIFDNVINAIKSLNIANQEQKKTFGILTIEAAIKCCISCFLLFWKMDIILLSTLLIFLRLITLNLFLKMGSSSSLQALKIMRSNIPWYEIKNVIFKNWPFIVIGSISIINWRIGNILVSKWLTIYDVAVYEISYKLFSLAYLLPVVVSTTVYPMLIKSYQSGADALSKMYHKIYIPYVAFGFLAFTFIFSYADFFIPILFGSKYDDAANYVKEMFLTILIFPTLFLQANVILTLKMEKLDMFCNIFSLVANILICVIGFTYYKNLTVVNMGLFGSFLIFHIIQDVMLVRKKITTIWHVTGFYICSFLIVGSFYIMSQTFNNKLLFPITWTIIGIGIVMFRKKIISYYKI